MFYVGTLYGHLLRQLPQRSSSGDDADPVVRLGLHRLPRGQFPRLRSAAPRLLAYDGAAELDLTLDVVLAGLTGRFARSGG